MKTCHICGKKQINDKNPFIHIYKDGNTSNNQPNNMILSCVNCMRIYKTNRMNRAVKTLFDLGLIFDGRNWVYDGKKVKIDLINVDALHHQIRYLKSMLKNNSV